MMAKLTSALESKGIKYSLRSRGSDIPKHQLLILDTFGELPYFYEYANISFAGRGHGVLEPLRYGKPVVVGPHQFWTKENSTSYLLYEYMRNNQALIECIDYDQLGSVFMRVLDDENFRNNYVQNAKIAIGLQLGASARILDHIIENIAIDQL